MIDIYKLNPQKIGKDNFRTIYEAHVGEKLDLCKLIEKYRDRYISTKYIDGEGMDVATALMIFDLQQRYLTERL